MNKKQIQNTHEAKFSINQILKYKNFKKKFKIKQIKKINTKLHMKIKNNHPKHKEPNHHY